jgi:hypothetical protein
MSREIRISTLILSALLIYSCATNRIQVTQKEVITCKTPKTRYDFGKNKPIQAIKSNNRKYTRYVYHAAWNNKHKGFSSNNTTGKEKHPGKIIYGLGETKNYHKLTSSGISDLMILQQIQKGPEISLNHSEFRKLQDPVRIIIEPKEINISPSQEDILFPINKVNNVSGQSQKTPFPQSGTFLLMMAITTGLIYFAAIKASPKLTSNISFWAAVYPWRTRFMFAGIQIALATAGVLVGEKLADNGIHFSGISRDLLLGAFLTSSLVYPEKNASFNIFEHSYLRQKVFDLALALSGFMLMVNAGNDPGMRATLTSMVSFKGHEQQNVNMLNDHSQAPKQLVYYQNDEQLQNEQTPPRNKETSRGFKIFYTVMAILVAAGLGYLVAVGACGLYCNGMVGLASIAGIGGAGLIIASAILVLKSIWHPKHKKRIKSPEGTYSRQKEATLQT